ncbi:MAG TPA: hypothetical protein VE987_04480, partial [Polyangiaceae bacterium]|nr:hypothetical protein [Polyangiaceae bacterium]
MRCALHDLATGPDGRCVVCRRASERGLSAVTGWLVLGGIGAVLTASVAYGAVRAWSARDAADVERPRPGAAAPPNDS